MTLAIVLQQTLNVVDKNNNYKTAFLKGSFAEGIPSERIAAFHLKILSAAVQ